MNHAQLITIALAIALITQNLIADICPLIDAPCEQLKACPQNQVNPPIILLPTTQGSEGQVLGLIDNTGTLSWLTTITSASNPVFDSLTVTGQNGAIVAINGLYTSTTGNDGTRLASFAMTSSPPVSFFQPVEPSRESYFFDDFIAFNANGGDQFYADIPWIIANNTSSYLSSQLSTNTAIGVTRITSGTILGAGNYLIKQLNGTVSQSVRFGLGPCLNEWRVSIPVLSTSSNDFTLYIGIGDNPSGPPNNGIFFSCDFSIEGGQWIINTFSQGSGSQELATGVSPQANVYQRLRFEVDSAGENANFYIDDIFVGTSNIGIPTATGTAPFVAIINSAGLGGSIDIDYWYFHYLFSAIR